LQTSCGREIVKTAPEYKQNEALIDKHFSYSEVPIFSLISQQHYTEKYCRCCLFTFSKKNFCREPLQQSPGSKSCRQPQRTQRGKPGIFQIQNHKHWHKSRPDRQDV